MFKKTLRAVAVLGAMAGSAFAADVTVYGVVDAGLQYRSVDVDLPGVDTEDTFGMKSGIVKSSRVGIKSVEDLGNGMSVGFVLENGFDVDQGTMGQNDRLFGREAQVNLNGSFGTVAFGRMGNLTSGNGSFGLANDFTPFGTSWGDYAASSNNVMSGFDRFDNMVTYASPEFSGFKVYAQYSFGTDSKNTWGGVEGKSSENRYAALGATFKTGNLNLVGIVDWMNYSKDMFQQVEAGSTRDVDDGWTFTLGGNYDFGAWKLYAGGQYFTNVDLDSIDRISGKDLSTTGQDDKFQGDGYGLTVGVDVPMGNGVFKVATAYMDATADTVNLWDMNQANGEVDLQRWNTSVGYQYFLSKRTSVYGVASYSYNNVEVNQLKLDVDMNVWEAAVGLVHSF